MASSASPPSAAGQGRDREVSLTRLYVLRATYLVFIVPSVFGPWPKLFFHAPTERGMINGIQCGLWLMAVIGVRYPLQMLPILLFEFSWKTLWLLAYGLPQWSAGLRTPQLRLDMILIGGGVLFALVIPWSYVLRHYVREPSERWR